MAKEKEVVSKAEETVPEESKYPREELVQHAQVLFYVMPEVVIGALHGNDAQELTKTEVQKAIDKFLKRRVK